MIELKLGKTYISNTCDALVCTAHYKHSEVFECINTENSNVVQFDKFGVSLDKTMSIVREYKPYIPNCPETVGANTTGTKFDSGKRAWWYMGNLTEEFGEVIDVLAYGDKKYPADDGCNWKDVKDAERRYVSALMRHLTAYMSGEKCDSESGKSHLAHLSTNALFLLWFQNNTKDNHQ